MGQNSLLLFVIGIILVGMAVAIGMKASGEKERAANADALISDAISIASDAQTWKQKPAAFDGGAELVGNANYSGLTFRHLGREVIGDSFASQNGNFTMEAGIHGITITGCNYDTGNSVVVTVLGNTTADIRTTISKGGCHG